MVGNSCCYLSIAFGKENIVVINECNKNDRRRRRRRRYIQRLNVCEWCTAAAGAATDAISIHMSIVQPVCVYLCWLRLYEDKHEDNDARHTYKYIHTRMNILSLVVFHLSFLLFRLLRAV